MKFHEFIQANLDAIVVEWEAFARTVLPAAKSMSDLALRNHSREILLAIVKDMQEGQTDAERVTKSRQVIAANETIAAAHGALRQAAGFDIGQVVSEFRALRSSVLALWRRREAHDDQGLAIEEIARFNEAIDQALGESVERYSRDVVASRDLFLAVVGHDLRSPLQGIVMASHLLAAPVLSQPARLQAAMRIRRASENMVGLVGNLLEFTRTRLGRGISIQRTAGDMGRICEEALDVIRSAHPQQKLVQDVSGELHVNVDAVRMRQVLSNLLDNAVQHGSPGTEVSLTARGEESAIVVSVGNFGSLIPVDALRVIFDPLVQMPMTTSDPDRRRLTSLGLGLFIVREIVLGHEGTIDVQSSADTGTVFTIRLPRPKPGEDHCESAARS